SGLDLYTLPAELLPHHAHELEDVARVWERESLLLPAALYLDARELEDSPPRDTPMSSVNRFLNRSRSVVFLDSRERWPGLDDTLALEVSKPTADEQRSVWKAALGRGTGSTPTRLAAQF